MMKLSFVLNVTPKIRRKVNNKICAERPGKVACGLVRNCFMIVDNIVLQEIQADWVGVRSNLNKTIFDSFRNRLLIPPPQEIRILQGNISIILAYGVLQKVLKTIKDQNIFNSQSDKLGDLMKGSKDVIAWSGYGVVDEGRNKRNNLAHEAQIIRSWSDIIKYINTIELNLKGWGIIS